MNDVHGLNALSMMSAFQAQYVLIWTRLEEQHLCPINYVEEYAFHINVSRATCSGPVVVRFDPIPFFLNATDDFGVQTSQSKPGFAAPFMIYWR